MRSRFFYQIRWVARFPPSLMHKTCPGVDSRAAARCLSAQWDRLTPFVASWPKLVPPLFSHLFFSSLAGISLGALTLCTVRDVLPAFVPPALLPNGSFRNHRANYTRSMRASGSSDREQGRADRVTSRFAQVPRWFTTQIGSAEPSRYRATVPAQRCPPSHSHAHYSPNACLSTFLEILSKGGGRGNTSSAH